MDNLLLRGLLVANLHSAHQSIVRTLESELKKQNLEFSTTQTLILHSLAEKDGLSITDLAGTIGQRPTSLYNILSELTSKKLIKQVRRKENKRVVEVYLTKKGKGIAQEVSELVERVNREAINGFSEIEMKYFYKVLSHLMNL